MSHTVYRSAQAFLNATQLLRGAAPATTSVLGSVASGVASGRSYERELWVTIADDAGEVIGCAMRTAPFNLTVSDIPRSAVAELASTLREHDPELPGIAGPRAVVSALYEDLGFAKAAEVVQDHVA